MAIEIIVPDNVPGNMSTGYQYQNNWLFAGFTNLCNVEFDDEYTEMLEGSVYFVNGKLFKGGGVISGPAIATNNYYYIYARGTDGSLYRSATGPVWNTGKCGYYTGNDRALVKIAKFPNDTIQRVDFKTNYKTSDLLSPPLSMFTKVIKNLTGSDSWTGTINRGWYKVTVAGGGGAYGAANNGVPTQKGGNGGLSKDIIFYCDYNNVPVKLIAGAGGESVIVPPANRQAQGGEASYFESTHPEYKNTIAAAGGGGGGGHNNNANGLKGENYYHEIGGAGGIYSINGVDGRNGTDGGNGTGMTSGTGGAGGVTGAGGDGWANLYTI